MDNQESLTKIHEYESAEAISQGELILGTLTSIDDTGQPRVSFQLGEKYDNVTALATIPVSPTSIGRQIGLLLTQPGNNPVIIGLIHNPLHSILDNIEIARDEQDQTLFKPQKPISESTNTETVLVNDRRLVIEGKDEIVLKCGESSITLNKNGKISIRGKYLLNRSTGVNRILGGSVQVN